MTAYAMARKVLNNGELSCQIQTLNKRFLDVTCSLPKEFAHLEMQIRKQVSESVKRGKVSLSFNFQQSPTVEVSESFNSLAIKRLEGVCERLSTELKMPEANKWSLLEGMLLKDREWMQSESAVDLEDVDKVISELVEEALTKLLEMKHAEGNYLVKDLLQRISTLKQRVMTVESLSVDASVSHREKLLDRLKKANLSIDLEDERILKEMCLFAEKVDISEEITRFNSHLIQLEKLLTQPEEVIGKKLDFIVQELAREINTMAAKTSLVPVSKEAIEVKSELEKIREQVQNIE